MKDAQRIKDRLDRAVDKSRMESMYRQMLYAYGEKWPVEQDTDGWWIRNGKIPLFPDIRTRVTETGTSSHTINTSYITLSRLMSAAPTPEFPQVDGIISDLRSQFWLARMRDGEWREHLACAVSDMDALGFGCVQIGIEERDGYQCVAMRNIPPTQVIYDRRERNPLHSKYAAFVHYASPEECEKRWNKEAVQRAIVQYGAPDTENESLDVVPVIEYFDIDEMEMATFLGDWTEDPVMHKPNQFERIPAAFFSHWTPPGKAFPVGRIETEMALTELLNEIERYLMENMRAPYMFTVDETQINSEDLQKVKRLLKDSKWIRLTAPPDGTPPIASVTREPIDETALILLQHVRGQLNQASQQSELDRGVMPTTKQTATAVANLQGATAQNQALLQTQTLYGIQRAVDVVLDAAAKFDNKPTEIDMLGHQATINDPAFPGLSIAEIMRKKSNVIVAPDSLTVQDNNLKNRQRLADLETLRPEVGITIDPVWFTDEKLKAIGEKDPASARLKMPMQPAAPAAPSAA